MELSFRPPDYQKRTCEGDNGLASEPSLSASEKAKRMQMLMTREWRDSSNGPAGSAPRTASGSVAGETTFACADGAKVYGCKHYKRKCALKVPCCGTFAVCRFCHEEEIGSSHAVDRFAVKEVKCLVCAEVQPVAAACRSCNVQFASYFCSVCNFTTMILKKIYTTAPTATCAELVRD